MRRLVPFGLLAFLLCCLFLPALAEDTATLPEAYVGEWVLVLEVEGNQLHTLQEVDDHLTITADGYITSTVADAPRLPLLLDSKTPYWHYRDPESGEKALIIYASADELSMVTETGFRVFIRPDASPKKLPTVTPTLATGGTWQPVQLYVWADHNHDTFSCQVRIDDVMQDTRSQVPMTITLPPFASFETIQQAWTEAVDQLDAQLPIHALRDVYGYELPREGYLMLHTSHGAVMLWRTDMNMMSRRFRTSARDLANWWRPVDITVGGIPLPASVMETPADCLAIDEQANVLLPDGSITTLRLEDDTLMLGDYPLDYWNGEMYLTLDDDVELRYITEAAWFRQQLCGIWQLGHIDVPAINLHESISPSAMDVQLIILPDDETVLLRYGAEEESFTLESTPDVTEYLLEGSESCTLTLSSLSTLCLSSESGSYTLWFKPAG